MTAKEKELLVKDLCGRIPYGVKFTLVGNEGNIYYVIGVNLGVTDDGKLKYFVTAFDISSVEISGVKPYLRPMSSMTEDEMKELKQEHSKDMKMFADCLTKSAEGDNSERGKVISHYAADWCNKNHFDYRGLIPMGLALEAPEGMYDEK